MDSAPSRPTTPFGSANRALLCPEMDLHFDFEHLPAGTAPFAPPSPLQVPNDMVHGNFVFDDWASQPAHFSAMPANTEVYQQNPLPINKNLDCTDSKLYGLNRDLHSSSNSGAIEKAWTGYNAGQNFQFNTAEDMIDPSLLCQSNNADLGGRGYAYESLDWADPALGGLSTSLAQPDQGDTA